MKPYTHFAAALLTAMLALPLPAVAADDAAPPPDLKVPPAANDKMVPAEIPARHQDRPRGSNGDAPDNSATYVDDATITTNVKRALANDASIAAQKVQVETQDGVVTVKGRVSDPKYASKIVEVIASVKGVKSVNNQLTHGDS